MNEVKELYGSGQWPAEVAKVDDQPKDASKFPVLEMETEKNAFNIKAFLDGKELFAVQSVEIKAKNEDYCFATITIPVVLKRKMQPEP